MVAFGFLPQNFRKWQGPVNAGSMVGTLKLYQTLKNLFELTVEMQKLWVKALMPGPLHLRSHLSHLVKFSVPNILTFDLCDEQIDMN